MPRPEPGKTSLLRAGVISELKHDQEVKVLPISRVGGDLPPDVDGSRVKNIYVFNTLLDLADEDTQPGDLVDRTLREGLASYFVSQTGQSDTQPCLLIIDQFEELFTIHPGRYPERADFFFQLQNSLKDYPQLSLLLSMREDYIAQLDSYAAQLPDRLRTRFRLELLGEKAARQAMQQPARQMEVDFTNAAAEKLVNDLRKVQVQQPDGTTAEQLGRHIEPVQLQVVCRRLWEQLPSDAAQIGETDVEAIGDVDTALADYYAERVKTTAESTNVRERTIREWFDRHLITEQGIRGQVLRGPGQSQSLDNRAIVLLEDAHLVRAEKRLNAIWYELAHDRLIEPIRRNNAVWFQANLSPLQRQADLWQNQGRSGSLLLRDEALKEADHWAAEHEHELTPTERDFLEACREVRALAEARQAIAQAERERRKNQFIQMLAVVAVIFSIVAGYFYFQARQSEKAAIQSEEVAVEAKEVAIKAKNESLTQAVAFQSLFQHESGKDERAALLARQAYLFNQSSVLHQVDNTLRTALPQHFSYILKEHENAVNSVAISPDGKRLVSGSDDKTLCLWDLEDFDGKPEKLSNGHIDRVWSVAFSPDGKMIASGSEDETVRWWILTDRKTMPQAPLQGHDGAVYSVAFSPDSKLLASGSHDRTVRLWNLEDPSADSIILSGHTQRVNSVAFSPDGTLLASGSDDGIVRLWDLTNSSPSSIILQGHEDAVYSVAFSSDGNTLASGSADKTIRLWEPQDPDAIPVVLSGHDAPVRSVAFSHDEKTLISGSDDTTVRLWNPEHPSASPVILQGHTESVTSVIFSPDGQTLTSGSKDYTVRQWNRQPSGSVPFELRGHTNTVWSLAFSPDGHFLHSISKNQALLWDMQHLDTPPLEEREYEEAGNFVAFSPDGTTLASGGDDVRLWDLRNPDEKPKPLDSHEDLGWVWSVAFSQDGTILVSGGDDVRLWDLTSHDAKHKQTLEGHKGTVYAVAFSPDGRFLASGGRGQIIQLWDLTSSNATSGRSLQGHEGTVYATAFSPDSKFLASGSADKTIRLWNLEAPSAAPIILRGYDQDVTSLAFSPDGETLVSGSNDYIVRIWMWRTEILAEMVCENVRHNLRLDEWYQFVSADLPYECTCPNLPPGEGVTTGARCE